jgi:hypothetical protein
VQHAVGHNEAHDDGRLRLSGDGKRTVAAAISLMAAEKNLPNCWALGGNDRITAKASARVEDSEPSFLLPNSEWATSIGIGVGLET